MKRIRTTASLQIGQFLKAGRKQKVIIVERIWHEANTILTVCGCYFDLTTHKVFLYNPPSLDHYDISHYGAN